MCNLDANTMEMLEKTVVAYLEQGRMFTAYDVTKETRLRENIHLRHDDVGGACHDISPLTDAIDFGFQNSQGKTQNWTRTRRDVPGTTGKWAWVYHPTNLDVQQYQFGGTSKPIQSLAGSMSVVSTPAVPTISAVSDGDTSDSGGLQDDGTFKIDFRNRLLIPTRFMKAAGIQAGDECYVITDSITNTVLVCKDTPALQSGNIKFTTQKVDKYGELQLSSRTLSAADLTNDKLKIENDNRTFGISGPTMTVVAVKPANT